MVAIITGKGTGLERSSAFVLGSRGQVGTAGTGGSGEGVYVNAANGNLVITRQDEFLIGFGPDISINRTYNSQAVATDGDNNDQWRMSPYRKIVGTSGAATVTRIDWDGSETIYTLNGTNSYICTDGAGAYDTLTWASSQWTWTDGNSRIRDIHDSTGKLLFTRDVDGTQLTYYYSNAGRVSTLLGQNGERSSLAYGSFGAQLLQVYTQGLSGQALATSSRVRFTYDASNRLQTATVDLSPDDLSITDGKTYVTTYGYDGTSKRVASISQSDGSLLQIGYTAYGSEYRVTSLTQTVASGVTRVTGIFYDLATRTTQITDPLGGVTTMTYDVAGNLTQLVLPAPTPGAAAPTTSYTYNANGDVLSMTENGLTTDYQYDAAGNLTLTRDAAGNTVTRTYGSKNELLTSTEYLVPDPDGAGAGAPDTPVTTRYAYDIENHLRFAVSGEGAVTEYRYDAAGQRTSTIAYAGNKYSVSGLGPTVSIAESTLAAWVADPGTDKSNARRTDTNYDFRGNVRSEVTHARLSVSGEGSTYPLEIVTGQIGQKTSTHLLSDGFYRVTKEGYHATQYYDAEAHSTTKAEGDFVLRLRPSASNKGGIVGVSTAPTASPSWNLDYSFFIGTGGYFSYLESGSGAAGGTYVTGDNLWLVRTGSTINYYKGATLEAAMTAGPMRTRTGATGTFYFDCSFVETGGTIDVQFTPLAIANGVNTSVVLQNDRLYRVTKTGGAADGWDADARSSTKAEGDFVLRLRPPQSDKYVIGGVSTAPASSAAYWNPEYGFFFLAGGQVNFMESGTYADFSPPVTYAAGDNFWLVRTGSTISYYKGATIEAARAAGALRTRTEATGTFYFDSSIYSVGGALDAAFTPDEEASSVIYLYDRAGQLLSRINNSSAAQETFIYDGLGRLTSVTDMANATTTFVFDNAASTTTATIAGGLTRVSVYNKAGELISVTESGGNVATAVTNDYHDGLGRLRMRSGPTGVTTYYVYDNAGRKVADIGTDGAMTEYVYDASSRLVKTIGYAGKLNPTQIGMLDDFTAGGNGSGGAVDRLAGLRPVASPADDRYQWRIYDAADRLIETIDGAGSATVYSYDGASRLLAATAYASQFAGSTVNGWKSTGPTALVLPGTDAANDRVARNFYNKDGLRIGALDGEGGLSENVYDSRGMLIETIRYATPTNVADRAAGTFATLKSGVTATTNPQDIHDWLVYDNRGLLRGRIDGEGNLTRYHYTAAGDVDQIVRGQKLDPAALIATRPVFATLPTSAGGQTVEIANYTRDGAGKLLTEARLLADGSNVTTTYSYDSAGRLTARTDAHATVAASTVTQRYDARGNMIGELGGEGSALLAALGPDPEPELADPIWAEYGTFYGYDAASRLISRSNAVGGRTLFYYDTAHRLAYQVDATGGVVEYRYNALGDRTETTLYAARIDNETLWELLGGNASDVAGVIAALADAALDDKTVATYNVTGRVSQSIDALGNASTYTYNSFGELFADIVPRDGAATIQTSRSYDRRGLLKTEIVDSAGGGKAITTSYGYDAFGRALTLTNALTKTTTSTYDRNGRLATQSVSPDGGTTVYTTAYTYDARGNLVAITDAANKITRFVYDKLSRKIATIDALGAVTTSTYDGNGRTLATRAYYTTVSTGSLPLEVTESALSLPGTHAADQVTRYSYDKEGHLRFVIDGLMHVVEYVYDASGKAVRTIAYDGTIGIDGTGVYSASWIAGQVAGLAGAAGTRTSRSVYDAANRLAYQIDAIGQVTWVVYDAKGQATKQVALAAIYTPGGDPFVGEMDTWRAENANSTDDRTTRAYYDRKGQLSYSIDELGYVTRYEYDKLGNVKKQSRYADAYAASDATTRANLDSNFASPPSSVRVTLFNYDSAGRLEETIDPEGYSTRLVLDALGQITQSTAAYGLSTASATTYSYDDVGRLKTTTRGHGTAEISVTAFDYDALGRITQSTAGYGTTDASITKWEYDELGRVKEQIRGYGTSEVAETQNFYDAFGRLTSNVDARGSVVSRTYTVLDQLQSETQELEAGTADDRVTGYTYDSFGNIVKVHDARGNDSFAYYDKLGRVSRQVDGEKHVTDTTYTRGSQVWTVKRWANASTATIVETTVPADPAADAARDATTTFSYNQRDELTAVQDAVGYTEGYTLNAFGERIQVRNKLHGSVVDGVTLDTTVYYTFDKRGLMKTETLPVTTKTAGGATIAVKNSYEYDARGNRAKMIEAEGAAEARTTNYVYDKLDRLIQTTHDAVTIVNDDLTSTANYTPSETIKYDRRGNVIEMVDAGGARTLSWYDDLDRAIWRVSQAEKVGGVEKGTLSRTTYDGNGNATAVQIYGDLVVLPASGGAVPSPGDAGNYRLTSFTYYRDDRVKEKILTALTTGEWNGSGYVVTPGLISGATNPAAEIRTLVEYDKAGNITHQEDGRGNDIWAWYDKLGRKTAEVDAENYLTVWTRDAEGNASSETRHATQLSSFNPLSPTPPTVAANAADRTTTFLYDRNGRRTQEERLAVAYTSVDSVGAGTDFAATHASAKSTITYTYNGLGEVLTRSEAAGATTNTYDMIGRLTLETGQSFTDYQGASVTPRTAYSYDGLNNLKSTRAQMGAAANDTNDRITSYTYGAGGRLLSMTDAANLTRTYGYDAAGRIVRDSYTRVKSNGSSITEAQVTRYDIAGRAIVQTSARLSGSTWLFTDEASAAYDAVRMRYNAFGEMSGRGVTAGPNAAEAYHESFEYDRGGRLWKTTQGDGVLRFYVYDRSGNQTLTLASAGANLSGLTLDTYAGSINGYGGTSAGAVTTIGVFDKRGQQIRTREPDRQLSASAAQLIVHGRTYNAFGEVASETDARGFDASGNAITFTGGAGYTTTFSYNAMGRLVSKVSPQVSVTDEYGGVSNVNPAELYGYDLSGRLVSVIDANNNRTTRLLLAGTGLGDSEASTLKEFTPHPSVFERKYDVFGAQRVTVDGLGKTETFLYDKMNRLVRQDHALRPAGSLGNTTGADIQLIDEYGYDGLGRRTQHWNSQFGPTVKETTDYDAQGRVEKMVDFGGDSTITTYAWSGSIAASGLGAVGGGWAKTTYNPDGTSQREDLDYFGRTVDRVDAGLHDHDLTFDYGGRLTGQSIVGGATTSITWFNTGLIATQSANGLTAAYGYDGDGRRTLESYGNFQNATVTWDALGRMKTYADTGAVGGTAPADIAYEYDAVGNVRRMAAHYSNMDSQGVIFGSGYTQEYWYKYDSLNRFTTTKGVFTGTPGSGAIVGGTQISYDAAGNRATATMTVLRTKLLHKYIPSLGPPTPRYYDDDSAMITPDDGGGTWSQVDFAFYSGQVETYSYTADGYLAGVSVATQELLPTGDLGKTNPPVGALGASVARGGYEVDAMGRVTLHSEYNPTGTTVYSRAATYNSKSQLTRDVVTSLVANTTGGTDTIETATDYYYATLGGAYLGGAIDRQITTNKKGGTLEATVTTTNSYDLWEGRRKASSTEATDYVSGTDTNFGSYYYYDGLGHMSSASIGGGRARTVTFVTDIDGRVLQRDEEDTLGTGDPRDLHYYFNGVELGGVSNNGTSDVDYVTGIARHTAAAGTGPFAGGAANATNYVDFDQSYDPINGITALSTGSRYTTVQGDTLQSVALAVWGDASLWYLIARANGLMGHENLAAGITLSIPNKVTNFRNASDTFKVYDPNKALGDLSPTAPKPPKARKGCGVIGMILLVAIAVAVTVVTAGATIAALAPASAGIGSIGAGIGAFMGAATAAGATSISAGLMVAAGAVGGALGSIASQGLGVATGLQEKFSWKGVAMSALSGAIGSGIGASGVFNGINNIFAKGAVTAATSSALSQGVGVATGLQKKFDWAGVVGAALAGGISAKASSGLPGLIDDRSIGNIFAHAAGSAAGAIANAAARTVLTGTSFGDNLMAVLPDTIGSTLGNLVGASLARPGTSPLSVAPQLIGGGETQAAQAGTPQPQAAATAQADPAGTLTARAMMDRTVTEAIRGLRAAGRTFTDAEVRALYAIPPPTLTLVNDLKDVNGSLVNSRYSANADPTLAGTLALRSDLYEAAKTSSIAAAELYFAVREGQATAIADRIGGPRVPHDRYFSSSEYRDGQSVSLQLSTYDVGGMMTALDTRAQLRAMGPGDHLRYSLTVGETTQAFSVDTTSFRHMWAWTFTRARMAVDSRDTAGAYQTTPVRPIVTLRADGWRVDGFGQAVSNYNPEYEPDLWNTGDMLQFANNCYAYAADDRRVRAGSEAQHIVRIERDARGRPVLDADGNPIPVWEDTILTPQPGYSGRRPHPINTSDGITDAEVQRAAERDGFRLLGRDHASTFNLREGEALVALFVDPNAPALDYHWLRQGRDAAWSGKPGSGFVSNWDSNGNIILDPMTAAMNFGDLSYRFSGYYARRVGAQVKIPHDVPWIRPRPAPRPPR